MTKASEGDRRQREPRIGNRNETLPKSGVMMGKSVKLAQKGLLGRARPAPPLSFIYPLFYSIFIFLSLFYPLSASYSLSMRGHASIDRAQLLENYKVRCLFSPPLVVCIPCPSCSSSELQVCERVCACVCAIFPHANR